MPYTIFTSDYMSSVWLRFNDPTNLSGSKLGISNNISTSFSPTTDWERVFSLGDKINQNLNISEGEILNEVKKLRYKRNS